MSIATILPPLAVLVLGAGCKSGEAPRPIDDGSRATGHDAGALADGGELRPPGEVRFENRPLGGEGSMGPREVSPSSDPALAHVRSYLAAHPAAGRLRIECTVSALKMSSMPDPAWGARLAHQVARKLVAAGVDCARLEPVGRLDPAPDAPGERVRFYVGDMREPRRDEARVDACKER